MLHAVNRCALALGLIAGCIGASATAAGTDTAVAFQNNIAHDGTQVDAALAPPYTQAWSVTLPGAVSYPLIADGFVFVVANGASNEPTLYALNQANGATAWSQLLPYPSPFSYPWANAAYDNGKVFAIGSAGVMSAYDAVTGTPAWSVQLPLEYLFSSAPTAANGIVYTNGAGSGGEIYAIDESDGAVLAHQVNMNGDNSSPALSNTSVYSAFACDQSYAWSLGTLAPIWHYSTGCEGGGGRTAVYANGRVYTRDWAGNGNLILDAGAGTSLGAYAATTVSPTAPAVLGNMAYYVANNTLTAQDVTTPASPVTKWSFAGNGTLVTAPIVLTTGSSNVVIVGSSTGALYAVDATTGAQVWTGAVAAAISAPDENSISQPLTGLAAGQGLLVVPAGNTVTAFYGTTPQVMPTKIDQCRNGGWVQYGFASQRACIRYVRTH